MKQETKQIKTENCEGCGKQKTTNQNNLCSECEELKESGAFEMKEAVIINEVQE